MSDKFYVYEHWRPDRGECFYVGKGHGRRANIMYGRNGHHTAIQAKLSRLGSSVEVRIIFDGLERGEALAIEVERIAFWRASGVDLANLTSGGETDYEISAELRERCRQAKLGKKLSEDHKAKIAKATRAALSSPEVRAKISAGLKIALRNPEVRAKLLKASRSQIRTAEHNAKIGLAHRGKKLSSAHAAKSRIASLGRKQRPEEIERRRAANMGKKRSAEFCQRMRELQARRTPAQMAAQSARTRAMNLNRSPEEKATLSAKLIARNKARTGKKCGPYRKRINVPTIISETVH